MTALYAIAMCLLLLAIVISPVSGRTAARLSALGCLALVAVGAVAALGGPRPSLHLGDWLGFGSSALRADGLAGIFLALGGLTGAATGLAIGELPPSRGLAMLHCVLVAAVAVAIGSDNAFLFFLAWEVLTVVILLLASVDRDRATALADGLLTGGLTKMGGGALLAAFALLYAKTGSFDLAVWAHATLPAGTRGALFALFMVAFGTKVGLMPLQGALPTGYGAAPRTGAASLSVALVAGFYGLWRFVFEISGPLPAWCGDALLLVASITALLAIVYAITEDDLRRFLGFSTVEHTGVALLGFAVALVGQSAGNRTLAAAGLLAATLHVCAHAIAKTLALIVADRIEQASGRRALRDLGGLQQRMRESSAALAAASVTLAAVPPLGGFVSEWFTFEALLQGFRAPSLLSRLLCALAAAALALTAGLGLLAFAKLLGFSTLGPPRRDEPPPEPSRRPASIWLLGLIAVGLGAAAPWEIHLIGSGLASPLGFDPSGSTISHPLTLGPVFSDFSVLAPTWLAIELPAMTLLAVALAFGLRRGPARRAGVWVTGSGVELAAVQYRPAAYSNPMRVVLRGLLAFRSTSEPDPDRPGGLVLERRVTLVIDRYLYRPASALALTLAAVTRRLQSGNLSTYLLYMLMVLILILALIPTIR